MAFAIGNTAINQSVTTTTGTVTISVSAGSVLLIDAVATAINADGSATVVTSVTSAHLTFSQRSAHTRHDSVGDTLFVRGERWWAYSSGALTSEVVTVVFTRAPDDVNDVDHLILATECQGITPNPASPWDGNASIPNYNDGQGNVPSTKSPGITTNFSQSVGLIVAYSAGVTVGTPTVPGTWTQDNAAEGITNLLPRCFVYHQVFNVQQSNASWASTGIDASEWNWISDAFTGGTLVASGTGGGSFMSISRVRDGGFQW